MDEVSPDNLFPASLKNEDMERLLLLCVEPFYGSNFGLQVSLFVYLFIFICLCLCLHLCV